MFLKVVTKSLFNAALTRPICSSFRSIAPSNCIPRTVNQRTLVTIGEKLVVSCQYAPKINLTAKRFKKKAKKGSEEEDDAKESDDEDDVEENPLLADNNDDVEDGFRSTIKIDTPSLRLDVVCKAAFGISRAKIEEHFYKGDIYVNGERAEKKGADISINDEIDLVVKNNSEATDLIDIRRIHIFELPDKIVSNRFKFKIHRWNELTIKPHGKE